MDISKVNVRFEDYFGGFMNNLMDSELGDIYNVDPMVKLTKEEKEKIQICMKKFKIVVLYFLITDLIELGKLGITRDKLRKYFPKALSRAIMLNRGSLSSKEFNKEFNNFMFEIQSYSYQINQKIGEDCSIIEPGHCISEACSLFAYSMSSVKSQNFEDGYSKKSVCYALAKIVANSITETILNEIKKVEITFN